MTVNTLPATQASLAARMADAIRMLSVDAVETARSGHPGPGRGPGRSGTWSVFW